MWITINCGKLILNFIFLKKGLFEGLVIDLKRSRLCLGQLGVVGGGSKFDVKQVNLKMTLKVKPIMGKMF